MGWGPDFVPGVNSDTRFGGQNAIRGRNMMPNFHSEKYPTHRDGKKIKYLFLVTCEGRICFRKEFTLGAEWESLGGAGMDKGANSGEGLFSGGIKNWNDIDPAYH